MTAIQYMFDFSSRVFLLPQDLDQLFSGEIAGLEYQSMAELRRQVPCLQA